MNRAILVPQLVLHEGIKLRQYRDTLGYQTIGVGYNISARGMDTFEHAIGRTVHLSATADCITRQEALEVLAVDIERVEQAVQVHFPYYTKLNDVRQRVVMDLAFNLGFKALNFKACIEDIEEQDWSGAAKELFRSKWAYQVDDGPGGKFGRADRLSYMLLTGTDVTGQNAIPAVPA